MSITLCIIETEIIGLLHRLLCLRRKFTIFKKVSGHHLRNVRMAMHTSYRYEVEMVGRL
jgi:hypothetical protein